jgi:hypothetical protein
MQIHIDLALLLAVILFFRLRPSGKPRSSGDVQVTAALVLVLGLLLAGTRTGEILLGGVGEVVGLLG